MPEVQKLDVFRKTARGALRCEFEHLVQQINAQHARLPTWNETKDHILAAFVAVDTQEAQRSELECVKQQPYEAVLSYNRHFRELAEEVFPAANRNAEQHRSLIKVYGLGLAIKAMAEKMLGDGWPVTIDAAMARCVNVKQARSTYDYLSRHEEPMEVGLASFAKVQPQPAPEVQKMATHMAKLEAKLDQVLNLRKEEVKVPKQGAPPGRPYYRGYQQRRDPTNRKRCFSCGKVGHFCSNCPARTDTHSKN